MRREEILDSWDEKQYRLLLFLHKKNFSATKEDCSEALGTNTSTLNKLISSLEELAETSHLFTLTKQGNVVSIQVPFDKNLDDVFHYLLVSSVKYQIISELFHKKTISIPYLEKKLGISYATFYRKLDEINLLLAEFEIKIENKTIIGSEFQIRHFLVELYTMTRTWKLTSEQISDKSVFDQVAVLNKQLQLELSDISIGRIVSYLMIVKFRYLQKKVIPMNSSKCFFDSVSFKRFFDAFEESSLYPLCKNYMDHFFSSYGIIPNKNEALGLLLFLMGNHILSDSSNTYKDILTIEANAQSMTLIIKSRLLDCFKESAIILPKQQQELSYLLSQIIWHHYLFKGWVTTENTLMDQQKVEKIIALFDAKDFITTFFIDYFPELDQNIRMLHYFNSDLYHLMIYYLKINYSGLSIGVHIEGNVLMKKILTPMIINRLNSLNYVTASIFDKQSTYDLVISNVNFPSIEKQGTYFYLINHEFYSGDLQMIENFVNMIIQNTATKPYSEALV